MSNPELKEQLKTLKELLENEKYELEMRKKWVKQSQAKMLAIENQIETIETTLKKETGN